MGIIVSSIIVLVMLILCCILFLTRREDKNKKNKKKSRKKSHTKLAKSTQKGKIISLQITKISPVHHSSQVSMRSNNVGSFSKLSLKRQQSNGTLYKSARSNNPSKTYHKPSEKNSIKQQSNPSVQISNRSALNSSTKNASMLSIKQKTIDSKNGSFKKQRKIQSTQSKNFN